ncbi:hypothetical protein HK099_003724 [Clydaea vesicula]|uniref:Uncharacterized protein n=1 Tax=Clydaea vesicula TaxID=447962 RepID=A0AAD5Y0R2_9FUNG|nr:hypothetical protein HK099_003724 [Clydaea vesicula]
MHSLDLLNKRSRLSAPIPTNKDDFKYSNHEELNLVVYYSHFSDFQLVLKVVALILLVATLYFSMKEIFIIKKQKKKSMFNNVFNLKLRKKYLEILIFFPIISLNEIVVTFWKSYLSFGTVLTDMNLCYICFVFINLIYEDYFDYFTILKNCRSKKNNGSKLSSNNSTEIQRLPIKKNAIFFNQQKALYFSYLRQPEKQYLATSSILILPYMLPVICYFAIKGFHHNDVTLKSESIDDIKFTDFSECTEGPNHIEKAICIKELNKEDEEVFIIDDEVENQGDIKLNSTNFNHLVIDNPFVENPFDDRNQIFESNEDFIIRYDSLSEAGETEYFKKNFFTTGYDLEENPFEST